MIIYSNGCSHSIGVSQAYSWSYVISKSFFKDGKYIRKNNSDKHTDIQVINSIKNKINLVFFKEKADEDDSLRNHDVLDTNYNILYNAAESGKGNDLIYFQTLEYLSECKAKNIKPDYVFIQWSGANRLTLQNEPHRLNMYTPANTEEHLNFEPYGSLKTISYIFSLQEILKNMGVEYYFCCYMELSERIKLYKIYEQIDLSKFITFDEESHPLFDGFRNLMRKNGYVMDGNGHPSFFGHWFLANKFLEKIDVDNLDIDFYKHISFLQNKKINFTDTLTFYTEKKISRKKTKSLWKRLGDATEEIKKNLIKQLF